MLRFALAFLLALASGCTATRPVDLRIATGDSGEALAPHRQILAHFAALEPTLHTRLEAVSGGDYYTRLLTEIASGEAPDLMQIGDDALALFVQRGALAALADERPQDWLPGVLEPGQWRGQQYLLPKDFTPLAVYCNLRLFREAGVPVPREDWTWEEFVQVARRLTRPGCWGVAWPGPQSGCVEYLLALEGARVVQSDGSYLGGLDSPQAIRALEKLHAIYYGQPIARLPSELGSFDGGNLDFEQGTAAMKVSGRWPLPGLRKRVELALLPMPRGQRPANLLFWAGMGVAAGSRKQAKAVELLHAYSGPEGSRVWKSWALPAVRSVVQESHLADDPLERVWLGELEHLAPRAYSYDPCWSQIGQPALIRLSEAAVVLERPELAQRAHAEALRAEAARLRRQAETL